MTVDITKIGFYTGANYMKRSTTYSGSTTVTLQSHGSTVSHTVTHNLGYVPVFSIFIDVDNDGTIWSGEKLDQYTDTSLSGVEPATPYVDSWSTTTALTISIDNSTTPTATGTRTVYWVIYVDYGDV